MTIEIFVKCPFEKCTRQFATRATLFQPPKKRHFVKKVVTSSKKIVTSSKKRQFAKKRHLDEKASLRQETATVLIINAQISEDSLGKVTFFFLT